MVAYLQSLGGLTPTVTAEDVAQSKQRMEPVHRGRALMDQHGCTGCHMVDGEGGEVEPVLTEVARRRGPAEILTKIADPTTWIAEDFEAGIMPPGTEIPEGGIAWRSSPTLPACPGMQPGPPRPGPMRVCGSGSSSWCSQPGYAGDTGPGASRRWHVIGTTRREAGAMIVRFTLPLAVLV